MGVCVWPLIMHHVEFYVEYNKFKSKEKWLMNKLFYIAFRYVV